LARYDTTTGTHLCSHGKTDKNKQDYKTECEERIGLASEPSNSVRTNVLVVKHQQD
ncbi:hypothetical protein C7460_1411, partial [Marinoscillum furvescens DSM 4134]